MNLPIEKECLAEVVGGILGDRSPNLGLRVKVLRYDGDDPHYGRIWLCEAEYAESWASQPGATPKEGQRKGPAGTLYFAQDWLKRIPEPPPKAETKTTEKELAS
jgi:hypothetical protein